MADLPLHTKRPRYQRRRFHVRLNPARHEFRLWRNRSERIDGKAGNRKRSDAVCRIEWRVLVCAVAERVLQVIVHPETGSNYSLSAEGTPCQADPWLRKKRGVFHGEERISNARRRGDDAVRKGIGRSASVSFIPARTQFVPESHGQGGPGCQPDHIFGVPCPEQRAPVHLGGRGIEEK